MRKKWSLRDSGNRMSLIIGCLLGLVWSLPLVDAEQTTPLKEGTTTRANAVQQQQPTLEQLQFQLLGSQVQALQAENVLLRRLLDDCKGQGTPNKEKK